MSATPDFGGIPDAPVGRIWDRHGFLSNNHPAQRRISEALQRLDEEHGYRIYLVIEGVLIGSRAKHFAAEVEQKWLPKGGGMILLYESDKRSIEYGFNPDITKEITQGKSVVPSHELIEIFSSTIDATKEIGDNEEFIEKFVLALCANFDKAMENDDVGVEADRVLRIALVAVGAIGVLALFGLLLGMLIGRDSGKRRKVKYFPEVDIPERLGAPYGSAWASLKFRKHHDE